MTSYTPAVISTLAPLSLTPSGGDATVLATELVGMTLGIKHTSFHHSGNVMPTAVVIPGADRRLRFSTPFAPAFAALGLGLQPLDDLAFFLAVFNDFNLEDGDVHQQWSLSEDCGCGAELVGWSVTQDGILFATVDLVFLSSDGGTDPLTIDDDQALPSLSGQPQLHTLGPVSFNGSIIPGVSSSGGSMGTSPVVLKTDGDLFMRSAARLMADPVLSLMHSDPKTLFDLLTQMGAAIAYNSLAYFKAYDPDTGVTSQDNGLSFGLAAGRIVPSGPEMNQGEIATTGVDLIGISSDGEANPITVSTGVTVPLPP